jgi:UDP:flavonoid glycosyltransferase YjiC (YdhE family)
MRVLIASWGWPSHYFPMVPTGWAFRTAGHDVLVASQPGLAEVITASGLPAVQVGQDFTLPDSVLRARESNSIRSLEWNNAPFVFGSFLAAAESMVDDLIEFAHRWRPDLIVYEHTTYAAPLAGRVLGIPVVRHLWGPDLMALLHDHEKPVLASLAERFGLADIETYGDLTLDSCPPAMQLRADYPRQRIRYVPYNGPGTAPPWLLERTDAPRVCVTMGTTLPEVGGSHHPIEQILEELSDMDVVLTGVPHDTTLPSTVPAHVRRVDALPLHLLLPTCDLLIHHGGPGTMMTGVASGVPQLVLPSFLPEQKAYGRIIARQGGALCLSGGEITGADVARCARELLEVPSYRAAARGLRDVNAAQPSLSAAVAAVTDLRQSLAAS